LSCRCTIKRCIVYGWNVLQVLLRRKPGCW
jgi:hypothetical protein